MVQVGVNMRRNFPETMRIPASAAVPGGLRAVIVMGVSGSGKTVVGQRLAERLGWTYRDADDLHPPENVARMRSGTPLTDADREPWLAALARLVAAALADDGPGLVLGCSALKRAYRERLGADDSRVRLVHLAGPTEVIRGRIAARTGHYMPATLLDSQLRTLEPPTHDERAIAVDISKTPDDIVAVILAALAQ